MNSQWRRICLHERGNCTKLAGRRIPYSRQIQTARGQRRGEKGQALVILAISFIVLLIFVGFTVDIGQLYIYMGHLRRSVDAGALAAAAQYREGRNLAQMRDSAEQIMHLNGVDPTTVIVETCDENRANNPNDPELCTKPKRKLVRVTGDSKVPMAFLHLIGVNHIDISAEAVSEAAALDVVLVVDISESMASNASLCDGDDDDGDGTADDGRPADYCFPGDPAIPMVRNARDSYYSDPSRCNQHGDCHPFEEVKAASMTFIDRVLDQPVNQEADRLAIVTFSNGWESGAHRKGTRLIPPGWMTNVHEARNAIQNLNVYQPETCDSAVGPCLKYDDAKPIPNYLGFECPLFRLTGDPASCTTTNIGGGLLRAGNVFADEPREDALWVVVLITDGAANASDPSGGHPYGYCPPSPDGSWYPPFCRDGDSNTRHAKNDPNYDADDYARDMADFVGCMPFDPASGCTQAGQGAMIYTIGLGNQVLQTFSPDPIPHGVRLLRDIAAVGDDGDPDTDPCADLYSNSAEWSTWCGNYYFEAQGEGLTRVFEDIASRMFTRLTH